MELVVVIVLSVDLYSDVPDGDGESVGLVADINHENFLCGDYENVDDDVLVVVVVVDIVMLLVTYPR